MNILENYQKPYVYFHKFCKVPSQTPIKLFFITGRIGIVAVIKEEPNQHGLCKIVAR